MPKPVVTRTIPQGGRWGWLYASGGNPPISAGVFNQKGDRLAWWPAGYAPTQEHFEIAYRMIIARDTDEPLSRKQLSDAFANQI